MNETGFSCGLIRQSSATTCKRDATYGCSIKYGGSVWVTGGCRGIFECGGKRRECPGIQSNLLASKRRVVFHCVCRYKTSTYADGKVVNPKMPLRLLQDEGQRCANGHRKGAACCAAECGTCDQCSVNATFSTRGGRCCDKWVMRKGRMCRTPAEVDCVVKRAGAAAAVLCHWMTRRASARSSRCAHPWLSQTAMKCVEDLMSTTSSVASQFQSRQRTIDMCLTPPDADLPLGVAPMTIAQRAGCAPHTGDPTIWMAVIVRDQTEQLRYWIIFHLALGVSRFLVYDNLSRDTNLLQRVLAPFGTTVTLIPWPGHDVQLAAYEDAVRQARRSSMGEDSFVACVDVDELIVPHEDGCLTTLMRRCALDLVLRRGGYCAGIRLSTRVTYGSAELTLHPPDGSPLHRSGFGMGRAHEVVKSLVRPSMHREWRTPHAPFTKNGTCLLDEALACPGTAKYKPFWRRPSAQRAFVLHMHCSSLWAWTVKRSLVGRIDQRAKNACPTCFGTLPAIAQEFAKVCHVKEFDADGSPPPPPEQPDWPLWLEEQQAIAFLQRHDGRIARFVVGSRGLW